MLQYSGIRNSMKVRLLVQKKKIGESCPLYFFIVSILALDTVSKETVE